MYSMFEASSLSQNSMIDVKSLEVARLWLLEIGIERDTEGQIKWQEFPLVESARSLHGKGIRLCYQYVFGTLSEEKFRALIDTSRLPENLLETRYGIPGSIVTFSHHGLIRHAGYLRYGGLVESKIGKGDARLVPLPVLMVNYGREVRFYSRNRPSK